MSKNHEELIVGIATDDERHFITRHFGDAERYLIYRLTEDGYEFLKIVRNTTAEEDEEVHADPVKAGSIAKVLKAEGTQVLASRVFGPNIKRMIKKFACVIIQEDLINQGLVKLQENFSAILERWEQGEERKHIKL